MTQTVEFTSRYQNKMYLVGEEPAFGRPLGFQRIEFRDGYFKTDDPEIVDWLTSHRDFGSEIFRTDTPGAYVPEDTSTKVVGGVTNTRSKVDAQRRSSRPPVATNVVEPVEGDEAS